jgi:uncharacterized membrane protein YiaA
MNGNSKLEFVKWVVAFLTLLVIIVGIYNAFMNFSLNNRHLKII